MGSQRVGHDWATELNQTSYLFSSPENKHKGTYHYHSYVTDKETNLTVVRREGKYKYLGISISLLGFQNYKNNLWMCPLWQN